MHQTKPAFLGSATGLPNLSRLPQNLKYSTFFFFCAEAQLAPSLLIVEISVSHTIKKNTA
jgi:hypothetical protein